MDKLYNRTAYPLSSEEICLKKYLKETKNSVKEYVKNDTTYKTANFKNKDREKVILSLMGDQYNSDTFKKLSQACSSDLLQVEGQPLAVNVSLAKRTPKLAKSALIPESCLNTLQKRKAGDRISPQTLRYTSSIWLDHQLPTTIDKLKLKPGERLVIAMKVYQPFKHRIGHPVRRVPVPSQEIYVLDTNTLAEFRDKISCISDDVLSCDTSDRPLEKDTEKAKDRYPSGMFYINNKFYIDKRHPGSIDYSEVIREWARSRNININLEDPHLMEKTLFVDLKVRLGFPYVYQHQGDCEHLICFSDVRWVTVNNKRVAHDPFYFCEECFMLFNYKNGEKIGDFKAYPFVSDSQVSE